MTVYYIDGTGEVVEITGEDHLQWGFLLINQPPDHFFHDDEGKTWWRTPRPAYEAALKAAEAKLEQMKTEVMLQMELIFRLGCYLIDEDQNDQS